MSDKLLVIVNSSDPDKARIGTAYAVNAMKNKWFADVQLFFFGQAESLLPESEELKHWIDHYRSLGQTPVACQIVAEQGGIEDALSAMGFRIEHVGAPISDLIRQGYTPMVW